MSDKNRRLQNDQQGIASLLFSMIMMIIISLIVLSFAQIARNGQRQTLDSQLSNQAYYAAESGVNDIAQALNSLDPATPASAINNTDCTLKLALPTSNVLSSDGVSYNCPKVNVTPPSLSLGVDFNSSNVLNLEPVTTFNQFKITWNPSVMPDSTHSVASCPAAANTGRDFTPAGNPWTCPYAVVRFDLVPTSGGLQRDTLRNQNMAVFAVPTHDHNAGPSQIDFASGANRIPADCDNDSCSVVIKNVGGLITSYGMRVTTKYLSIPQGKFNVTAHLNGGSNINLEKGQALVDVTGRAQDVMRRVQVRLPYSANASSSNGSYADYALGTQNSICKRFKVGAEGFYQEDNTLNCYAHP